MVYLFGALGGEIIKREKLPRRKLLDLFRFRVAAGLWNSIGASLAVNGLCCIMEMMEKSPNK
jgi:hypothetical protein